MDKPRLGRPPDPNRIPIVKKKRPGVAELIHLARNVELFKSADKLLYGTFTTGGHKETWNLKSEEFYSWLAYRFFKEHQGLAPTESQMKAASNILQGRARYEGALHKMNVRYAWEEKDIWIDMVDEDWKKVHVTEDGWRVVKDGSGPKFRRGTGMTALPDPDPHGDINLLRPLFNVGSEEEWQMIIAWILYSMKPSGPYPILIMNGEQGSAKSTVSRMFRCLIDPSMAPLSPSPRTSQEMAITASNSWLLAFDNISHVTVSLSDDLCRLATGGGFRSRTLYTNSEEFILQASRPVLLNGIDDFAVRADLLDRSIWINFPPIADANRRLEDDVWAEFNSIWPKAFGGLLDAMAAALRNRNKVQKTLKGFPRMADFAAWTRAAEEDLPWDSGGFDEAFAENRRLSRELALIAVPAAAVIVRMMQKTTEWSGTSRQLLDRLNLMSSYAEKRDNQWPTSALTFGNQLRRLTPPLLEYGIVVTFRKSSGRRTIQLRWVRRPAKSQESHQDQPALTAYPADD